MMDCLCGDRVDEVLALFQKESEIGLELESLRVTPEGMLAHTPHPFPDDPHLDRDFCENQTEIITPVFPNAREACASLQDYYEHVVRELKNLPAGPELFWPFSNPPYCKGEGDVPIAQFYGDEAEKTAYREYLSAKYGKKIMLLSGIHYNFSFSQVALKTLYAWQHPEKTDAQDAETMRHFADGLYLNLAEKAAAYSWLIVALTAASPVTDGSFWEDGAIGRPGRDGLSSVRCSEFGYWNHFVPTLAYESVDAYIDATNAYIRQGLLDLPRELYYPIRLKPRGTYDIEHLRSGIGHIEFRMLDVNPLSPCGLLEEDAEFLVLLIALLALTPVRHLTRRQQEEAIHNMQAAAHAPLEDVQVTIPHGEESVQMPLVEAGLQVLEKAVEILGEQPLLRFQKEKLLHPEKRYAEIIRRMCGEDGRTYVEAGIALASEERRRLYPE